MFYLLEVGGRKVIHQPLRSGTYIKVYNNAMVASILHAIAFEMCHVISEGIPHDHVVYYLIMWYAFLTMWYALSKAQKTSI